MKLTTEVQDAVRTSVLCWLATADEDGVPSVSPKEVFAPHAGERVIVANIASPRTAANIKQNPRACVAVLDVFSQRGFQISGPAEYITGGDDRFEELAAELRALAGEAFPFSSLFAIEAEEVRPVVAPRYRLFPDTTETEQRERAMASYGVRPAT